MKLAETFYQACQCLYLVEKVIISCVKNLIIFLYLKAYMYIGRLSEKVDNRKWFFTQICAVRTFWVLCHKYPH